MTLKIIQWNIKGYSNNYNELLLIINTFSPQIISLQATHLFNTKYNPTPVNYEIVFNNPTNRFGGTALLIHRSLQFSEININCNKFDVSAIQIESIKKIKVLSIYISPNIPFSLNDLNFLRNFQNSSTLLTGDFNSWHQKWGSTQNNQRGNTLLKFIDQSNLILLNDNSPTHFTTHNTFTHIDLSFCSPDIAPNCHWKTVDDLYGSDPFPITISLFKLKLADWNSYKNCTLQLSNKIPTSSNSNKEAANLNKIILQSAHKTIPQTTPNVQKRTVPWCTKRLADLKLLKNRAWQNLKHNINKENIIKFRKASAIFRFELRQSKRQSTTSFTTEIEPSTPTSKIWKNIRTFCGLTNNTSIHCIKNFLTGQNITSKIDIANTFAQHWSQISHDSSFSQEFITNKYKTLTTNYNPSPAAKQIETDITYTETLSALHTLKGNTPGYDRISYQMIKNASHTTKYRITQHFNNILNSHIPQSYKSSLIIPILKPNKNKTDVTSYRPISLNPCIAKLLDKIIAKRLWWFVTRNNYIHPNQLGFKRGKSVADCLIYVDHLITESLSKKSHTSIISLDFSKAFDRIGVHAIIDQLQTWKTGPKITNYVANFMKNRRILVRVGPQTSNVHPLFNGIPQGSPISVILFVIAYNRLAKIIQIEKRINFTAFADDFHLIIKLNKQKNQTFNLDTLFHNIDDWGSYSGANLSPGKCKHMHICRKHNCTTNISSNNTTIPTVKKLKILGITFANNYRWNCHINELAIALSKRLDIIKCLASTKFNTNTHTLLNITRAIITSKLDYGLYLFGNAPKSILNKLKTKIHSAIRTSLGAFHTTPIKNMLLEANIYTLENRYELQITKLFKTLLLAYDTPLSKLIKNYKRTRKTKKKINSVLDRTVSKTSHLNLPFHPQKNNSLELSWNLPPNLINIALSTNIKPETPKSEYKQKFLKMKDNHKNHTFIYTDGSQINKISTYAITTDSTILKAGILPPYASVLSTEIIAILEAIKLLVEKRGNFIICSDSLSSLKSILNINNYDTYPYSIRSLLIKHNPKIKLVWIPGHCGIAGNELADQAAKEASRLPLITTNNVNIKDINHFLKNTHQSQHQNLVSQASNWYQQVYQKQHTNCYYLKNVQNSLTRLDQIKIVRLRLGHTKLTNIHLIDPNTSPLCTICQTNSTLSPEHILETCPSLTKLRTHTFNKDKPSHLLSNPNLENMHKILTFLKLSNLYHRI